MSAFDERHYEADDHDRSHGSQASNSSHLCRVSGTVSTSFLRFDRHLLVCGRSSRSDFRRRVRNTHLLLAWDLLSRCVDVDWVYSIRVSWWAHCVLVDHSGHQLRRLSRNRDVVLLPCFTLSGESCSRVRGDLTVLSSSNVHVVSLAYVNRLNSLPRLVLSQDS